ncbi:acyl-CoA-binding domain-containing protein 3-like isoform X2 [Durio zibethinus]|uniref:Acyl-CoA-binding domain-containing protein 3-like isoform X2 n=1 Tax=Durio zibethinus TaxID=66656 RepID=A0A6P6AUT8_DURZI|nr:acyl-CoA-binding domain-containing protein 3-like isoform X2 [Durio zibethinus]
MEIILELFLTAFIALLFSFLIAKIVSLAMGGDSVSGVDEKSLIDVDDETIMEELEFSEKLKVQGIESEKKVQFVKELVDKVDVFEVEQAGVDQGFESEKKVEWVEETADKVGEFGAGESEVVEILKVQGFESEKEVEFLQETAKKVDDFEAEQAKVGEAEADVKLDDFVTENKTEKKEVGEIAEELEAQNETKVQSEEISVEKSQMKGVGEEEKNVKLESDDDDWEGIERSELEKVFGAAVKFVEHKGDLEGVGNDVQMELYGLHKIATEGPCREPQPLAFMVSSRSKWNAWQRLGNMNPEVAMEQYVALLSDRVPGFIEDNSDGEHKFGSTDRGVPGAMAPDINSFPDRQTSFTQERNEELKSVPGGVDINENRIFEKQAVLSLLQILAVECQLRRP